MDVCVCVCVSKMLVTGAVCPGERDDEWVFADICVAEERGGHLVSALTFEWRPKHTDTHTQREREMRERDERDESGDT